MFEMIPKLQDLNGQDVNGEPIEDDEEDIEDEVPTTLSTFTIFKRASVLFFILINFNWPIF